MSGTKKNTAQFLNSRFTMSGIDEWIPSSPLGNKKTSLPSTGLKLLDPMLE
jgi:hypothetical protein